jgi:hypothetical protein
VVALTLDADAADARGGPMVGQATGSEFIQPRGLLEDIRAGG